MSNRTKNIDMGGIIKLGVVGVIFFIILYGVFSLVFTPKKTTETHYVVQSIVNNGFSAEDFTEAYYQKDPGFKQTLIRCVGFEENDIHFEFFEFNNVESARETYRQARQLIYERHGYRKGDSFVSNYAEYVRWGNGKYSITVLVGNTVLYAYCDEENELKINTILDEIDYLEF